MLLVFGECAKKKGVVVKGCKGGRGLQCFISLFHVMDSRGGDGQRGWGKVTWPAVTLFNWLVTLWKPT